MSGPSLASALAQGLRNTVRSLAPMALGTFLVAIYLVTSRPIFLVDLVVFPVAIWGLTRLHLDALVGRASWGAILSALDGQALGRILNILGLVLLFGAVAIPIGLFLWAGGAALTFYLLVSARAWVDPVDRLVWALVQISPLLATVPLARFLLAPFVLVDRESSLWRALGDSWSLTRGRTLSMLTLACTTAAVATGLAIVWQTVSEIAEYAPTDRLLESWLLTVALHLGLAALGMALAMVTTGAVAVLYRAASPRG